MSDLANLIQNLESELGAMRQELSPAEWNSFKALLAEAAPCFQQAADDPDARLEAIHRLKQACLQFPATRRVLPVPGGQIPAPRPAPPPSDPVSGLPASPLAQSDPDVAGLMAQAQRLCNDPDGIADRSVADSEKRE